MVLVFKTNLSDRRCINDIASWFEQNRNIAEWSVDLEDCDNVLRVVAEGTSPETIMEAVRKAGFQCEVLE